MTAAKVKVIIKRELDNGLLIASYGDNRSEWKCCKYCTSDEQIIPTIDMGNAYICQDCGAIYPKSEDEIDTVNPEDFFFFKMKTGSKYHISNTDKTLAITGRKFDKSDVKKGKPKSDDDVCIFCMNRLNDDYSLVMDDIN